jgi:hypothetical protein
MTTEDQDAEVGRLVRERRDLRAHHEALLAKAHKLAELLSAIGQALRRPKHQVNEHKLRISQDGAVTVSNQYRPQEMLTGKFPAHSEINGLLQEIQGVEGRLGELESSLKSFGV